MHDYSYFRRFNTFQGVPAGQQPEPPVTIVINGKSVRCRRVDLRQVLFNNVPLPTVRRRNSNE